MDRKFVFDVIELEHICMINYEMEFVYSSNFVNSNNFNSKSKCKNDFNKTSF